MTKRHRQLATQLAEIDGKRQALLKEGQVLSDRVESEKRPLLPEEKIRRDAILAELDELKGQIDAVNADIQAEIRLEEHERGQIADVTRAAAGGPIQVRTPFNDEFSGFGEFLQGIACQSSMSVRAQLGADRTQLLQRKLEAYSAAASGMSVGIPSDGGFLVRKDWSTAMMDRAREQARLFPRCRQVPIGGDFDGLEYPYVDEASRATGSRWGGVQVYWKAEAAAVTAKQPKIGKGELRLEEIMGLAYATERLIRDATALESLLGDAFESDFAFKIDDAIMRGTGVGMPLGFFVSPVLVSVAKEGSQVADTVVVGNVLKMWARMPGRLKPGAVWLIHSDVMTQLPQMTIGDQPVWLPPGGLMNSPTGLLLGKPVLELEQCEALGDQGDIFLVNLNEYVAITKAGEGLRFDTSMHVRFLNDEMAFRWVYRVNGQPTWRTSLTPFKGTSTMSPFITLDARA
jgi:HK97 family phage major capsid protein